MRAAVVTWASSAGPWGWRLRLPNRIPWPWTACPRRSSWIGSGNGRSGATRRIASVRHVVVGGGNVGVTRVGTGLDSASVATRMALLVKQAASTCVEPHRPARETYGTKRTKHLGTMLGRSAMYFPVRGGLDREGCPWS